MTSKHTHATENRYKHNQTAAIQLSRTINWSELVSYLSERLHRAGKKESIFAKKGKTGLVEDRGGDFR